MADKVTTMELKVDLQCPRCYRKIKKVLCKFPEIRDQMYDEKQNKVTITVVTCCPDIIRNRISSKGGRSIDSIEIITDKKKETVKKKEGGEKDKPKEAAEKKKEGGEKDKPKEAAEKKKEGGEKDKPKEAAEKKKEAGGGKDKPMEATADKKKEPPKEAPEKKKDSPDEKPKQAAEKKPEAQVHKDVFEPVSGFPTIYPNGLFYNNQPFYQGYGSVVPMPMPCFHGHGMPCMCYGVPANEGFVGNRGGYNNTGRFDYFSEENPEACSIM